MNHHLQCMYLYVDECMVFYATQKFKVTDWPKEDYGKFYSGDSYIVLNVSCDL